MRARNIKPGFFKNELLADLSPAGRLFFQGLWCVADREGRMEDRPRRLWAEVMPYDPYEGEEALQKLEANGFIIRYEVGGVRYLQIVNFLKHQSPHCKEKPSVIPAPHGAEQVQEQGEHQTSTVQAPDKHHANTSVAPPGFPDSLIPREETTNPDGLVVADGAGDRPSPAAVLPDPEKPKPRDCPHQQIIDLYHEILPELARVKVWDEARQGYLRKRWREDRKRQSLDWWRRFFTAVRSSPFLMGEVSARDRTPFNCTLEWLIKPANFRKVIEGYYSERRAA